MRDVFFPTELEGEALFAWHSNVHVGDTIIFHGCLGGDAVAGLMAARLLWEHEGRAIVEGVCAGAHLLPLAAIKRRSITPYAQLGFNYTTAKCIGTGTASDLRRAAEQLAQIDAAIVSTLARGFGVSKNRLHLWMKEGRWMDSEKCLNNGIATTLDSGEETSVPENGSERRRRDLTHTGQVAEMLSQMLKEYNNKKETS